MTDPYIIKDAKPRWSRGKLATVLGGSALAGALVIGGTAFAFQQLGQTGQGGVSADQETELGVPGDHEDGEGFGEDHAEFGEDRSENGDHEGRGRPGEDADEDGFAPTETQAP